MPSRFIRCDIVRTEAGSSVAGLAAYIARARRQDHSGAVFNFAHRAAELAGSGLILPPGAADWATDPARLWREAERAEQTIDRRSGALRWKKGGQIARHMTIALPREVTPAQRREMLLAFIAEALQPERHGVAIEWAIHTDDNNPHAHLLISTRALNAEGFGKKARAMNPGFASRGKMHFVSEGDDWDKRWAVFQDEYFARAGIKAVVRERQAVAEPHYARGQMRTEAVRIERDAIAEANAVAAQVRRRDPDAILADLTARKAIFTSRDLRRALAASGLEGEKRAALEAALLRHRETLTLVNEQGETIGWTTRTVRAEEAAIIETAAGIAGVPGRSLVPAGGALLAAAKLSDEQRRAAAWVTGTRQLAIVIGRAGTGKSHTLKAVRRAFEAEGRRIVGLAPTNSVVGDLRRDGYRHAATLHRELGELARGKSQWDRNTVVMVDEAAMIDNEMLARLLTAVKRSGARLILTGDDRQFASVARGGMFSDLVERHGAVELTEVRRQLQAYQVRASIDFARGDILAALAAYDQRGQIVWCDTLEEARTKAVAAQAAIPGAGFLYASTNREVEALNRLEQQRRREERQAAGETIAAQDFRTVRGAVSIAAGERVQFHETDRNLGVATSEFGTVRAVTAALMEVVKDDGSVIRFDPRTYDQWGLGYSGTGYKGQGKTQPRTTAVYDSSYAWDARAAYVIGTRHRDDYRLFVPRDLAPNLEALAEQILRQREDRGSSLRFAIADKLQARQEQQAEAARERLRAALEKSRKIRAEAARQQEQRRQKEQATAVEKALASHRAAFRQNVEGWKNLTSVWRGSAEDEAALAGFVTRALQAARAIAGDPALLAALRKENAGEASQVEEIAGQDRDRLIAKLIANIRRKISRPGPNSVSEVEPNPETPAPSMRR